MGSHVNPREPERIAVGTHRHGVPTAIPMECHGNPPKPVVLRQNSKEIPTGCHGNPTKPEGFPAGSRGIPWAPESIRGGSRGSPGNRRGVQQRGENKTDPHSVRMIAPPLTSVEKVLPISPALGIVYPGWNKVQYSYKAFLPPHSHRWGQNTLITSGLSPKRD